MVSINQTQASRLSTDAFTCLFVSLWVVVDIVVEAGSHQGSLAGLELAI